MVGRPDSPRTADAKVKPPLPALLGLALLAALAFGGWSRRDASFARSEAKRLGRTVDSLRVVKAKRDTIYQRDTVRLTRWRDSLVTLRDSLTITDTVEVVRFIATQDSTITACVATVRTCEQRVADRDALLDTRARQWAAERAVLSARIPSLRDRLTRAGLYVGIGYLTAKLTP